MLTTAPVAAIPWILNPKITPAEFLYTAEILYSSIPKQEGYNSDNYCQDLLLTWWKLYREARIKKITQKRTKTLPWDSPLRNHFTDYPDRAPVESFGGEALKISRNKDTWRKNLWACMTACQDLRITLEWIIAILLENKVHVRARTRGAFLCAEGLVSTTYSEPSVREPESPSATQAALASLSTLAPSLTDPIRIHGRIGELTKCRCIRPSPSERALAESLGQLGPAHDGVNVRKTMTNILKQRQERGQATPNKTAKVTAVPAVATSPVQHTIVAEEEFDLASAFDYRYEDMQMNIYEPITCYDYDFPEFGSLIMPDTAQAVHEPAEADVEAATEFLRAALLGYQDYEWPSGPGESSSGSNKRKGPDR